jgi:hypothetical protein
MDSDIIKWFGVPAAIVATVTLPWLVRKYQLECAKLSLEIQKLRAELGDTDTEQRRQPGRLFTWFARYWPIPTYGAMGGLACLAVLLEHGGFVVAGIAISLVLFVAGSAVEERHRERAGQEGSQSAG